MAGNWAHRVYTDDGALAVIDDIAARVAPDDPQLAQARAFSTYALTVGTLQTSRAPALLEVEGSRAG